jgi:hypothetical protein
LEQCHTHSLNHNRHCFIMMETKAATHRCLESFRWESLRGWDFRPQLIVVSGLFGGNPFVDGILGHSLLLSRAFRWESLRGWYFRPQLIVVSGLFSQPLLLFTMEFWLLRSLFRELFSFS